jgi:Ca-activated chloride channel family protein
VTALYELVLGEDPLPDGSDPVHAQGETGSAVREVDAADLALVKVRYKAPGAATSDAASEVSAAIAPAAIASDAASADEDLRWATAVAAFAEILKGSTFADRDALDDLGATFEAQRDRDADRAAFAEQFRQARALLH